MKYDDMNVRRDVIRRLRGKDPSGYEDDVFADVVLSPTDEDDIRFGRKRIISPEEAVKKHRNEADIERKNGNREDADMHDAWADAIEQGVKPNANDDEKKKGYENYIFDAANGISENLPLARDDDMHR